MNTRDLLFSVPVEAVSFSDTLVEVSKVKAGTNVTMGVE